MRAPSGAEADEAGEDARRELEAQGAGAAGVDPAAREANARREHFETEVIALWGRRNTLLAAGDGGDTGELGRACEELEEAIAEGFARIAHGVKGVAQEAGRLEAWRLGAGWMGASD